MEYFTIIIVYFVYIDNKSAVFYGVLPISVCCTTRHVYFIDKTAFGNYDVE